MKFVTRTYRGETKKWPVYTLKEAEERGIGSTYWKDVEREGQYGRTDDGYVAAVIGVNGPYPDRNNSTYTKQIVFPFCRMFASRRAVINFEDFYGHGDYSSSTPGNWAQNEKNKRRTKRVIRAYAMLLLTKGRVPHEDLERLGRMWRPEQEKPALSIKRLLKSKTIQKMVEEQIVDLLNDKGVDPGFVVDKYKEVLDNASKANQFGVAKGVLDTFSKMLGMDGKIQPQGYLPPGGAEDADLGGLLPEAQKEELVEFDDAQYIEEV